MQTGCTKPTGAIPTQRSGDKMGSRDKPNKVPTGDAALCVVDMPQLLRAADLAQDEGEAALAAQFIEAIYILFDDM